MSFGVRPARDSDVGSIVSWTTDTFSWGDYVPDRIEQWLAEENTEVLVCVDTSDTPVAVAHVLMLSATEGWMEGARVHPEFKRQGLGSQLNDAGVEWARERGVRVMRLATESDNSAARAQVEALGYRMVSQWVFANIDIDPTHRAPDQFKLRPAPGSDAEAAWLFWAASDLSREGRELVALGWQWRTARPEDFVRVVGDGEVLQSPAGWVAVSHPEPKQMRTQWMATTPDDLLVLLDGLHDLAAERGATGLDIKLPDLGWTTEALVRAGGDPGGVLIYAKAI